MTYLYNEEINGGFVVAGQKMLGVLKGLIISYLITIILLFAVAVVVYKVGISDTVLSGLITAVYIFATFLGGFVTGKKVQEKKFVWGALFGFTYILIAVALSAIVGGAEAGTLVPRITKCVMCVAGGMLGSMLA